MNQFVSCFAILGAFLASFVWAQEHAEDANRLFGTWKVISAEYQGSDQPEVVGHLLVFDKVDLSFQDEKGKPILSKGRYRLDTSKTPKEIDILQIAKDGKDKFSMGIYEFKGDQLRLCYAAGKPRPADFQTKAGDGRNFVVLERVEKK